MQDWYEGEFDGQLVKVPKEYVNVVVVSCAACGGCATPLLPSALRSLRPSVVFASVALRSPGLVVDAPCALPRILASAVELACVLTGLLARLHEGSAGAERQWPTRATFVGAPETAGPVVRTPQAINERIRCQEPLKRRQAAVADQQNGAATAQSTAEQQQPTTSATPRSNCTLTGKAVIMRVAMFNRCCLSPSDQLCALTHVLCIVPGVPTAGRCSQRARPPCGRSGSESEEAALPFRTRQNGIRIAARQRQTADPLRPKQLAGHAGWGPGCPGDRWDIWCRPETRQ